MNRVDERIMNELRQRREWLLSEEARAQDILMHLRREMRSLTRNIYFLGSIPEQYEDLYDFLIDADTVVRVEIPRDSRSGEVVFEKWSTKDYRRRLSGRECHRFQLALKLAIPERKAARQGREAHRVG
jgi:hypothetical protein